jgi:hypothetical protein
MHNKLLKRFLNPCCDNRKTKAFSDLRRRIQYVKWGGPVAIAVLSSLFGVVAQAQQPTNVARIAYLHPGSAATASAARMDAFRQGLRDLGYIEGKNITIVYRYSDGNTEAERLPELAAELVNLKWTLSLPPVHQVFWLSKRLPQQFPSCLP